ncbi:hypothetical protein [Streptomyces sp. NBC_01451]|uniref:hypothetical protein n=1 Tax=Streptomyces sp. NBC_01451 TaxID=2903872 RepID=UPI002E34DABC|nr:hypothetical protein [Streptomyces sp. NBC_01451]
MTPVIAFWFPDNTVLCNFACVDRIPLLEQILNGRGRWTTAVAYEAKRSAQIKYRSLQPLVGGGFLGEPIEVKDDEADAVETVRASFGGTSAMPMEHLGEAETLHVIQTRREFKGNSTWISDDRITLSFARKKNINVMDTTDLMGQGCVAGDVMPAEAKRLLEAMRAQERTVRVPRSIDELIR